MDVDSCIRKNISWQKLPEDVRTLLGNAQREYDKLVLEYSIKNQLRYRGNLVRHVKKNEETYYDMVMKYSESHLMLFPYHLADIIVKELRITPFNYYTGIIAEMINSEKSYDSLPNFTAADAMRLLGIGRNQYIDLVNQNRSNRKFLRRNKSIRELLPTKPAKVNMEPWWIVCVGNVLESDIKTLSDDEKRVLDSLYDHGSKAAGYLSVPISTQLFNRGLVYFDVPVQGTDYVYVAPLDGFVMNRVLGDYFETLLYKVFVAIDEQTSVQEMADMLHIDLQLVCTAISVFCRLGFARKRVTGMENSLSKLHYSWSSGITSPTSPNPPEVLSPLSTDVGTINLIEEMSIEDDSLDSMESSMTGLSSNNMVISQPSSDVSSSGGRAAFLFDSFLAAFLMMGNLSTSLKGHAVTLFEVGKLADEQMGDFMDLLESVNRFGEGEAQRYSEHAVALLDSLRSLKKGREVDLLRGESLLSLDAQSRMRVLAKAYGIIVAMAPLSFDACTLPISSIPFIGPPIPEACSPWFRLAMAVLTGSGPASAYFPRGYRLTQLPELLVSSSRLHVSSSNHEPQLLSSYNALLALNDMLTTSALFVQTYPPNSKDEELLYVPFPFVESEKDESDALSNHPAIQKLAERIGLNSLCGYVVLLRTNVSPCAVEKNIAAFDGSPKKEPDTVIRSLPLGCTFDDFLLHDCIFGIPLFNAKLNHIICERATAKGILEADNRTNIQFANKAVVELIQDMLTNYNFGIVDSGFSEVEPRRVEVVPPVQLIRYDPVTKTIVI